MEVTRNELWGALQRIPPAGYFATRMGAAPYAQALLLSIQANRECESCRLADNGGGFPCGCPVPCGARYCQHPVEGGTCDPWAPDDDVVDAHICCEHADAGSVRHIIDTADPELTAMAKVIAAMEPLDHRARQRIRMWVDERWATRG